MPEILSSFFFYLVAVLSIGVLVFVHEFGHFIVAKWCGVGVIKFSVGFGPAIFRFTIGETIYQISCIPLGGFVRMVGDMPDMITGGNTTDEPVREGGAAHSDLVDEDLTPEVRAMVADRSRWFIQKNLWQRAAIVFAGPLFNILFAILVAFVCAYIYGEEVVDAGPRIGKIIPNSPAERAGLVLGDEVTALDGKPIDSWELLATTINEGSGAPIAMHVRRDAKEFDLSVVPAQKEARVMSGGTKKAYFVGIAPLLRREPAGLVRATEFGFLWTYDKIHATYYSLLGMLRGHVSSDELAGPLFIVNITSKQAAKGAESLFFFTAYLSVSLAVLNLLPIPILDGGHLMFFFLEALFGPISVRKKEFAQQVGMLLLLCLMVFAIRNDIVRDTSTVDKEMSFEDPKPSPTPQVAPQP